MEINKIDFLEIRMAFDELINGKITREEVSSWANKLQCAQDNNTLVYSPDNMEDKIWKAIQFLQGVDLKDSPSTYLHNLEDIRSFYSSVLKDD